MNITGSSDHFNEQYPLHFIIKNIEEEHQYIERIEQVLKVNEINMDIQDQNGETALHCAASRGIAQTIRKLLSYKGKICVDSINYACETPLHFAVGKGCTESVKVLLEFGADPNTRRAKDGSSPLHIAAENNFADILLHLLQFGAKNLPNFQNNTPLHVAALNGNENVINYLLNNKVNNVHMRNNTNKMPLQLVIENMYPEYKIYVSQNILKKIFKIATVRNDVKFIDCLLKFNNMDTNSSFLSAMDFELSLYYSAGKGDVEIIDKLLCYGADINSKHLGNTALCLAAQKEKKETVKFLIQRGAEVNLKGRRSKTPLHRAAKRHNFEIVEILLKAGADPNSVDAKHETPLHEASLVLGISELLLEYDADVFVPNEYGETPFIVAGEMAREEVLLLFRWNMVMREVLDTYLGKEKKEIMGPEIYEQYGETGEMDFAKLKCLKESERFDSIILDDISFLDILTENFRKLYHHMGNERLQKYVNSDSIVEKFPIYAKMIRSKFRKTMQIATLLKPLGDSKVSLYDILTKSHSQLASLLGNKEVVEIVESINLREATPRYALQINRNFTRALRKRKLLDDIIQGISVTSNDFKSLTNYCVEIILDFLDDVNLKVFRRALCFESMDETLESTSEEEIEQDDSEKSESESDDGSVMDCS